MPTTARTAFQERWAEIVHDPALQDLPYKVETNARGQLILSPPTRRHAFLQRAVQKLLVSALTGGDAYIEIPVETSEGVKQVDVAWISDERRAEMENAGDPADIAPEICVEVLSPANSAAEMETKRRLYRNAGADEVWLVDEEGRIRFFADDRLQISARVPDAPDRIEV